MAHMDLEGAMRVAEIFEADDIISVPAMACRVLLKAVKELTDQIVDLNLELKEYQNEQS